MLATKQSFADKCVPNREIENKTQRGLMVFLMQGTCLIPTRGAMLLLTVGSALDPVAQALDILTGSTKGVAGGKCDHDSQADDGD